MTRLQRVVHSLFLMAVVSAAAAFAVPATTVGTPVPAILCGEIADQLGVRLPPEMVEQEFGVGTQFTGTLQYPDMLTAFGVKGMHAGARVMVLRTAPEGVLIEADELVPPQKASVRLKLGRNGKLQAPPKV